MAHHADDQVETFLLRLARGSGVEGLAAMAPESERDGIVLVRPLLSLAKVRLLAYCNAMGQPWINDPSNQNSNYGRVRFRAAREMLAREGLSQARLLATAGHMRRARTALDHYVRGLLERGCAWDEFGVARLALNELLSAPEEVALRTLAAILKTTGGQIYPPRFERLQRLHQTLRQGPWRDATLHGCCITRRGLEIIFMREAARITDSQPLSLDTPVLWDGRFHVTLGARLGHFRIARLSSADKGSNASLFTEIPAAVRETLPAVFDSEGLAAFPYANFIRPDLTTPPCLVVAATHISHGNDPFKRHDADM